MFLKAWYQVKIYNQIPREGIMSRSADVICIVRDLELSENAKAKLLLDILEVYDSLDYIDTNREELYSFSDISIQKAKKHLNV